MTLLGAFIAVQIGKHDSKTGNSRVKSSYDDYTEYSKTHQKIAEAKQIRND